MVSRRIIIDLRGVDKTSQCDNPAPWRTPPNAESHASAQAPKDCQPRAIPPKDQTPKTKAAERQRAHGESAK